ncbi:MAG: XrtA/PEP-CTERM system histidine kinase PrsK [bacterium]
MDMLKNMTQYATCHITGRLLPAVDANHFWSAAVVVPYLSGQVINTPFIKSSIDNHSIPSLVNFVFALCFGMVLLYQNHRHTINRIFFFALCSISIAELANFILQNSSNASRLLFWGRIGLVGYCLAPGSWSLLSLTFARSSPEEAKKWIKKWKPVLSVIFVSSIIFFIFIPSDLFIYLATDPVSFSFQGNNPQNIFYLGKIGKFFLFFLIFTFTFILVNLETLFRNAKGIKKWQIKYSIMAMFSAFLFYIYITCKLIIFPHINLTYLPIGSTITFICLGLLAFSIFRHQLTRITIGSPQCVVYGSFTGIVISSYLVLIGLVGELARILKFSFNQVFSPVLVLAFLMVTGTFILLEKNRRLLKAFIGEYFYSYRHDYREEWIELTNRICSPINLIEMLANFSKFLSEVFYTDSVVIFLYNEDDKKFYVSSSLKPLRAEQAEISVDRDNPLMIYLEARGEPFDIISLGKSKREKELVDMNRELFSVCKVSSISPLIVKEDLIGFITLGKEITGAAFNQENYQILKAYCLQVSSQIINIKLSERLITLKEIEFMDKVSSFILHDLKNGISMLSLLVQNATQNFHDVEFQKDSIKTISNVILNMNKLIGKVSCLPKGTSLNKVTTDLTELLHAAVENAQAGSHEIRFIEVYGRLPKVKVDREKIQSVVNNLIINAQEAMKERKDNRRISVSATFKGGTIIIIEVEDNGSGMSKEFLSQKLFKPFQTSKKGGLGIGLYQSKLFVAAHGGKIEVTSEEGKGTTFRIFLPVETESLTQEPVLVE